MARKIKKWRERKFGGQTYQSHPSKAHGTHASKRAANNHANKLRKSGYKARVTKDGSRHRVWQGPRRKR